MISHKERIHQIRSRYHGIIKMIGKPYSGPIEHGGKSAEGRHDALFMDFLFMIREFTNERALRWSRSFSTAVDEQ